jgi:hypothetical protein
MRAAASDALNDVHDGTPDPEEDALQEGMRRPQRELVEGQFDSVGPLLELCNLEL